MTNLEILQSARARIAKGWTQGVSARLANGRYSSPHNPHTVSFCAAGALIATDTWEGGEPLEACGQLLIKNLPAPTAYVSTDIVRVITTFNDHPNTTQDDILALYDRTIEKVEASQ
jgi:hypothetical protein